MSRASHFERDARAGGRGRTADGERHPPLAGARRPRRGRGRKGRGRAVDGVGGRVRRDRPRRDASGPVRLRRVPAPARARRLGAGADADRAGRGGRPRARPRQRRRRLPREAVRARGAPCAPPLARAPRPAGAAARPGGRRAAARPRAPRGAPRRRAHRPLREGVRAPRDADAPSRRGALPDRARRARVGHCVRAPLERRRRLHAPAAAQARRRRDRDRPRRRLPAPRRRMSRLPIRLRVAAAFAAAMAVVLAGTGLFVYARLGNDLSSALDQDLRLRAQDLSALVRSGHGSLRREAGSGRLAEPGESFAQLVGPDGRVVDATPPLGGRSLLRPRELGAALHRARFVDVPSVPGLEEPARLLAVPVRGRVLVVGATRENRAEALRNLRTELLIAGPLALLLATGLGYLLAGAGLRAVETMRRRAAEISADRPGERLPLPGTRDELDRLGETLNEMLARLEAAIERERDFVAEAGHELRTPLALLRAELDFALHHAESEEE